MRNSGRANRPRPREESRRTSPFVANCDAAAGFDVVGGGALPELLVHAGNNPMPLCPAPVFNPAKSAVAKNPKGSIARSAPPMRPLHISTYKCKRARRFRFNFRGSPAPPESLNRSEFAGLKSAACGSPPRRAYRPYRRCGRVAEGGGLLNRFRGENL